MKKGAFTVVFNQKGEILLNQRRDIPLWVLPGGGVEKDENEEEAAVRETQEETGFQIRIKRKVAIYRLKNQKVTLFEGRIIGGRKRLSLESQAVSFFPITNLPRTLFPPHKRRINDTLKKENKVLSYVPPDDKLRLFWLMLSSSEWRKILYLFFKRRFYGLG